MANEQHLKILRQGVDAWNGWRRIEQVDPDLSGADLSGALLEYANFSGADLRGAILESAKLLGATFDGAKLEGCTLESALTGCNFMWVDLRGRNLSGMLLDSTHFDDSDLRGARLSDVSLLAASLMGTDLRDADLKNSDLVAADLSFAKLSGANLRGCSLGMAFLVDTDLAGADLAEASLDRTILANLDLSVARGLREVEHEGPSSVGTDTLERTLAAVGSDGKRLRDVEAFFRGAGVAEHLIAHFRSRAGTSQPSRETYIICSRRDAGFAQMLFEELQTRRVRCWLDLQTRSASSTPILSRMSGRRTRTILCASTRALATEWAQEVIAGAMSLERRGDDGFLVVDLDGCLGDGGSRQHAAWLRSRMAADMSKLANGDITRR